MATTTTRQAGETASNVRPPRYVDEGPVRRGRAMLARVRCRLAMEELSGEERVALACAPRPEPLTPEELDHWSRQVAEEAICEGRHGDAGSGRVNPHDD